MADESMADESKADESMADESMAHGIQVRNYRNIGEKETRVTFTAGKY